MVLVKQNVDAIPNEIVREIKLGEDERLKTFFIQHYNNADEDTYVGYHQLNHYFTQGLVPKNYRMATSNHRHQKGWGVNFQLQFLVG